MGALTGGKGDKSVDAVFIDGDTKTVVVVQGKYRQSVGGNIRARK